MFFVSSSDTAAAVASPVNIDEQKEEISDITSKLA